MILFLDFDGVLHPDGVYLVKGRPVLRAEGALFMWAPLLADALKNYPAVQIVLSTGWAHDLRFARAPAFFHPNCSSGSLVRHGTVSWRPMAVLPEQERAQTREAQGKADKAIADAAKLAGNLGALQQSARG